MPNERWTVGDITITKVVEVEMWVPLDFLAQVLPSASRADVEALTWLYPNYLRDEQIHIGVYSFLVETPSLKLIVDTGVGNAKRRTADMWSMLDTDYLTNFRGVWDPADVDAVINTHMHVDHVGGSGWPTTTTRWTPSSTPPLFSRTRCSR